MSLMNTLYVWFPASWGPSVVEAISKRNQTWLQQHPVHRDPAMFNAFEVENGPASREMTYKIQKWNVNSPEVHPILVANARVDWMALQDSELTQQFEILREGILRDVFSQRASSAWQGMQPQRLTVSLLLPGGVTADQWLDFLQSQRQFWPTMTTRHASLAPIRTPTFQRERRQIQSKHLWDTLSIDWSKLSWKLYTYKPTGLSREDLWTHLFVTKHRANPYQEREYQGADQDAVYDRWYQDKRYIGAYKVTRTLLGIDIDVSMVGFNIDNITAKKALQDAKDRHARRWQTKEGTYRLKEQLLPDVRDNDIVMADSSTGHWLPPQCDFTHDGWNGSRWPFDWSWHPLAFLDSPGRNVHLLGRRYLLGQLELCGFFREFNIWESASDVSLFHLSHHPPLHLPVAFSWWLWLFALGFVGCSCFPGFASARGFH